MTAPQGSPRTPVHVLRPQHRDWSSGF